ncbi:hypothetical protein V4C53_30145 [Paraburkholderia azotifigens]|uniref:hypothetical protein n=1 Tax=Paraburkholderia azotifigens TaxID=2057004 RepID=UPI0031819304
MSIENGSLTVQTSKGEVEVALHVFPAFTGFELNRRYRTDYRAQKITDYRNDKGDINHATVLAVRNTFAMNVLSFAEVGGKHLNSPQAINDALESWKNVEAVFNAILRHNEVDLQLEEEKARWFEFAGAELAATFIAEAGLLLEPLIKSFDRKE